MQYVQIYAANAAGAPLPNATIAVYQAGTTTPAPLFGLNSIGVANPLTATTLGEAGFAVADGLYDIAISSADGIYTAPKLSSVQIVDSLALAQKVNTLAVVTIAPLADVLAGTSGTEAVSPAGLATWSAQYRASVPSAQAGYALTDPQGDVLFSVTPKRVITPFGRSVTRPSLRCEVIETDNQANRKAPDFRSKALAGRHAWAVTDYLGNRAIEVTADQIHHPAIRKLQNPSKRWHNLRRGLSRVLNGIGNCTIAVVGDSTSFGLGAGTDGGRDLNCKLHSTPYLLAEELNRRGQPALCENMFGDGNSPTGLINNDPRITVSGGWGATAGPILGANWIHTSSAGTFTFTNAQYHNVDTLVFGYATGSGNGSFTYSVDGGAPITVNSYQSSGNAYVFVTVALGTPGVHAIAFAWVSSQVFIGSIQAWDSTRPTVNVLNMGWCGGTTTQVLDVGDGFPWAPLTSLPLYKPDLTIVDLGINDRDLTSNTPAQVAANLTTIIRAARAAGSDVILCVPQPSGMIAAQEFGWPTQGPNQALFNAAIRQAATQQDVYCFDEVELYESNNRAATLGYNYDGVHYTALGYGTKARALANLIGSI